MSGQASSDEEPSETTRLMSAGQQTAPNSDNVRLAE